MERSQKVLDLRKSIELELSDYIASTRLESHFDDLKWKPYPFEAFPFGRKGT
jgi:hypothetical protein